MRKALISAAKMNEAGNDVNLRGDSPHILNLKTNQVTALRRVSPGEGEWRVDHRPCKTQRQ